MRKGEKKMNWVEEAFEEIKEDEERFWKMNPDFSNAEIEEAIKETRKELKALDKDIEECWKEYADAPKLSDEELDKIIKEVRREILSEKVC